MGEAEVSAGEHKVKNLHRRLPLREPVYDLRALARYNLHIHSIHSSCARLEMEMCSIIEYASSSGLEVIAITDHYNSPSCRIVEQNERLKQEALKYDGSVDILYGAELSAYGVGKYLDSMETNRALDYRLYAYNHYHLDYWEHPRDRTPRGYAEHGVEVLRHLLVSGRADCIAHPFVGRYIECLEDKTLVTKALSDNELGNILEIGKQNGIAWEINPGAMFADPEFAQRYWSIGKEVGVVFVLGTDAHRLSAIDTKPFVERLRVLLEIEDRG